MKTYKIELSEEELKTFNRLTEYHERQAKSAIKGGIDESEEEIFKKEVELLNKLNDLFAEE